MPTNQSITIISAQGKHPAQPLSAAAPQVQAASPARAAPKLIQQQPLEELQALPIQYIPGIGEINVIQAKQLPPNMQDNIQQVLAAAEPFQHQQVTKHEPQSPPQIAHTLITNIKQDTPDSVHQQQSCETVSCSKRLTFSEKFKFYRRIHTDVELFQCAKCGKKFMHSSSLNRHKKTHYKSHSPLGIIEMNIKQEKQDQQDNANVQNYTENHLHNKRHRHH